MHDCEILDPTSVGEYEEDQFEVDVLASNTL